MLCYVILCYVMLCYVMLCYVMLCYAMLCDAVMWCNFILFYVTLRYVCFRTCVRALPRTHVKRCVCESVLEGEGRGLVVWMSADLWRFGNLVCIYPFVLSLNYLTNKCVAFSHTDSSPAILTYGFVVQAFNDELPGVVRDHSNENDSSKWQIASLHHSVGNS